MLSVATATLCVAMIHAIWERNRKKRLFTYQQVILWVALLEMIIAFIFWGFAGAVQVVLSVLFVKQFQLCLVCYFYAVTALRLLHRLDLERRLVWPFVAIAMLAFTAVFIVACSGLTRNSLNECADISFLLLSAGGFALSILFGFLCAFCSHLVSQQNMSQRFRAKSKGELWVLAVWFFVTNLVQFVWDLTFLILNSQPDSQACHTYSSERPSASNIVVFIFRIITILLPVWAELWAFRTVASPSNQSRTQIQIVPEIYRLSDAEREKSTRPIRYGALDYPILNTPTQDAPIDGSPV
ncbi:MAG: hypothetical protein Q8P67_00970 [archaeon]|nr:hypothetical protein [archaeon]